MANASHDGNHVHTLLGTLNTDGVTTIPIKMNSSNNRLKISDATTGSDMGMANMPHDGNFVSTIMGVSSADGVTPVTIYCDANGNLLINSQ